MNEFEKILDECVDQITSGTAGLEDCLAKYPQFAAELKPLLKAAMRLENVSAVQPSLEFKRRSRIKLKEYMRLHPNHSKRGFTLIVRLAGSLAVLAAAVLATGTVFAQNALPGQALYGWKLSSEQVWRTISPDPVSVDLILADRRVSEIVAVQGNPLDEAQALNHYQDVFSRLKSEANPQNSGIILDTFKSHQEKLSAAGIDVPDLQDYLSQPNSAGNPSNLQLNPPGLQNNAPPGQQKKLVPTVQVPNP